MLTIAKKLPVTYRYLSGIGLSLLALLLQLALTMLVGNRSPFLIFIAMVALSSATLGPGPAALVLLTGCLYGAAVFLPSGGLALLDWHDQVPLLVYAVVGLLFLTVGRQIRAVTQRALDAELSLRDERQARQRAHDARLRGLFQQSPGFMTIMHGPGHMFDYENDAHARLHGGRPILGRTVRDAFPEVAGQGHLELLDRVYRSGEPYTAYGLPFAVRRGEGAALDQLFVDLVYQPIVDDGGAVTGIFCQGFDVTERKQTEERYRSLFDAMDQGFCVIEMLHDGAGVAVDYRILEMNPVGVSLYRNGDVVGKTARQIMPEVSGDWIATYDQVARTGRAVRFERQVPPGGRWFEAHANRLGGDGSRKVALLFSDITERKDNEARLRRLASDLSEADRRKTEFLAVLAHELRNPLAPIRSGLDLLKAGGADTTLAGRVRDMMERQVRHMVRLVDDLLDVARISGGKIELRKEPVALSAVFSAALESTAPMLEQAGHTLTVTLDDEDLALLADPTRLVQIVGNLLNNAAKYTPAGGSIRLDGRRDGAEALITVADNGIGIAAQALPFIFDMFSQVGRERDLAHGGLGIGLSLVKRLVALHGGAVSVESGGEGAGASFTVRLPLDLPPAMPAPGSSAAGSAASSAADSAADSAKDSATDAAAAARQVLVVDDNVDAAEMLASLLEMKGHQPRVAHGGEEALRLVEDWTPDVALIDIGMPGMNGYELAQALRARPALQQTVLVALTGWGAEADRSLSRQAGFAEHLTKPVDFALVEAVLAKP